MQVVSTYLCLSIYLSVCLSVCLSVSIYLTIYLHLINIYIYIILTRKLFDKQETLRTRYRKNLPEQNRRAISSFKTRHHPGRKTVWEKLCSMALLSFFQNFFGKNAFTLKRGFLPTCSCPRHIWVHFFISRHCSARFNMYFRAHDSM